MTDGERQGAALQPIVAQGRNCWRIARADRASVIVDAADYYRIIAAAMEAAQQRIFIVGWDFDTRIALDPDEQGKGETLGHFFLRLAHEKPERQIDILKWNFGALKQFFRPTAVVVAAALVADQGDRLPLRRARTRRAAATTRRSS